MADCKHGFESRWGHHVVLIDVEGFVFELRRRRDSNTEPRSTSVSRYLLKNVERLGFVELHSVLERGRPNLRVELGRFEPPVS